MRSKKITPAIKKLLEKQKKLRITHALRVAWYDQRIEAVKELIAEETQLLAELKAEDEAADWWKHGNKD